MTGSLDDAIAAALGSYAPRPGFSAELLVALKRAAVGLRAVPSAGGHHDRWVLAGSIAGVATAASAAVYGFVKINRRGSAA